MTTVTYSSTMYRGVTQKGMTEFSAGSFYSEELSGAEGYAHSGGEVHEIEAARPLKLLVISPDLFDFDIDEIWDHATAEMINNYDGAISDWGTRQICLFGTMKTTGEYVKSCAEDCLKEFAATYRRRDY